MLEQAHAQSVRIVNTLIPNINNVSDIFALITNVVLGVGIALVVIFLIIGGIQYVTARGDVKQAEAARSSLTNAVIGFIIVIAAFTIRLVIGNLLDVDSSNLQGQYINDVIPGL